LKALLPHCTVYFRVVDALGENSELPLELRDVSSIRHAVFFNFERGAYVYNYC
jgi:hypothetical protein